MLWFKLYVGFFAALVYRCLLIAVILVVLFCGSCLSLCYSLWLLFIAVCFVLLFCRRCPRPAYAPSTSNTILPYYCITSKYLHIPALLRTQYHITALPQNPENNKSKGYRFGVCVCARGRVDGARGGGARSRVDRLRLDGLRAVIAIVVIIIIIIIIIIIVVMIITILSSSLLLSSFVLLSLVVVVLLSF